MPTSTVQLPFEVALPKVRAAVAGDARGSANQRHRLGLGEGEMTGAENGGMNNDTENARTELDALLQQAFFEGKAGTEIVLANPDVVLRALGGVRKVVNGFGDEAWIVPAGVD